MEVPRPQNARKGDYVWEPKLYDYVPTGELALQLTNTAGLGSPLQVAGRQAPAP